MARVAMLRSKCVGGVEPRLDREARALAEAGHEVHAVLWDRDLAHPAMETRSGYTIHRAKIRAPYNKMSLAWKLPRWWRAAFATLRTIRPDIVHAADFDTVPPALRAKSAWGARFVFDIWDFYGDMITRRIPAPVRRWISRWEARAVREADLVILPTLVRASRLHSTPRMLIEIANVPDEQPITARRHPRLNLFYAGNLSRDRGVQHLVPACEAVAADLIVAGQGPDEKELVALIGKSTTATFLGSIPHEEVLRRTAGADVIPILYDPSVPNNRLASPNKLFEALMCGKPVIVSDGIEIAELARQHRFGLVVPYGDIGRIVEALRTLVGSEDIRSEMGRRGRALYEAQFRWEIMKRRLIDAYQTLSRAA